MNADDADDAGDAGELRLVDEDEERSSLATDPLGWLVPQTEERRIPRVDAVEGPPPVDVQVAPGSAVERLHWAEPVVSRDLVATPVELAYELSRIQVGNNEILVLEKVMTYLRVYDGNTLLFRSDPNTDPFPTIANGAGTTLNFRWFLAFSNTGAAIGPLLTAAQPSTLPRGRVVDGLPQTWADLRYGWNSRATGGRQSILQGGGHLRIFVVIACSDPFLVRAATMLAGYCQNAGDLAAALRSTVERA